jgi:hypothetical protein
MGINFLAVLVAAAIRMAVGALWYSSAGFSKQWMALAGITKEKMDEAMKKGMGKLYATEFGGSLITSLVLAGILANGPASAGSGAVAGAILWLGFVATSTLSDFIFAQRPMKLYWINNGYNLVALILTGALLAVWR